MPLILFTAFIVVPIVELWVILQVGQRIGALATVIALLLISVIGAALVKREGLKAWNRFREALAAGRIPAKEVVDGVLLLTAGALLLTPGFVTDGVGLALLLPPSRALVNRSLRGAVRRRLGFDSPRPGQRGPGPSAADSVDVEVVKVERSEAPVDPSPQELNRGEGVDGQADPREGSR